MDNLLDRAKFAFRNVNPLTKQIVVDAALLVAILATRAVIEGGIRKFAAEASSTTTNETPAEIQDIE